MEQLETEENAANKTPVLESCGPSTSQRKQLLGFNMQLFSNLTLEARWASNWRKAGRCRTAPAWGCSHQRGEARKRQDRSWPSDIQLQTAVAQMELENKNPKLRQMLLCTGAASQRNEIKEPESPFLMELLIQWALGTG